MEDLGRDRRVGGVQAQQASEEDDDDDEVMAGAAMNLLPSNNGNRSLQSTLVHGQECHDIIHAQHGSTRHADWALQGATEMSALQHQLRSPHAIGVQDVNLNDTPIAPWTQIVEERRRDTRVPPTTQRPTFSNAQALLDAAYLELSLEEQRRTLSQDLWQQQIVDAPVPPQDIHLDALPVDHPHRFYDVSDFLDNWSTMNPMLEILQARKRRLACLDPYRDIFGDTLASSCLDPQGIDWPSFKVTRHEATEARQKLHPQRIIRRLPPATRADDEQRLYRFRSFHARHRASNAHYQLRNVLAASSRAEIFYAAGSTVTATNLTVPSSEDVVMDFNRPSTTAMPFRITCVSTSSVESNAVVVGGFNGEYAVLRLDSDQLAAPQEGFISHAYDGLVTHVNTYHHRHSSALRAAFSTNDRCIRVMDVTTLGLTDVFQYNHAINATCMSPDGRLRLLVGDNPDALVTDAEQGTPLVRLGSHVKDGFACAWSEDGTLAATGAQDGIVAIWDTRNWLQPLETLRCRDTCARSLHFTDENRLVMAENEDVVSIYDVKTKVRQDIRLFGSIAGTAVLDGGREIIVAISDLNVGGLMVLEQDAVLRRDSRPAYGRYDEMQAVAQRRRNELVTHAFGQVVI